MFKNLPGFRDFYPEDCAIRNHIFKVWRNTARLYGFSEYDVPVLEPLELFKAKSGPEIVNQLFNFQDQGQRQVALRPEQTPSLARLVGAKANSLPKPIKWFTIGENFRYERPQKGRLRSFYQLNCDVLGESSVSVDAHLISLLIHSLTNFGLTKDDFIIRLSDRDLWTLLLQSHNLDQKLIEAALGVIDKMERMPEEKTLENLNVIFGEKTNQFHSQAKELSEIRDLDKLEAFFKNLPNATDGVHARIEQWKDLIAQVTALGFGDFIRIDLSVVRGLAYYTGFVYEAFQTVGKARAIAGGGRYDHLVKKLGGTDLPAAGFAIGDVTLRDLLEEKNLIPKYLSDLEFYLLYEDEKFLPQALEDVAKLRETAIKTEYSLKKSSSNKQFKQAEQLGAKNVIIYGEKLEAENLLVIKDLGKRSSENIDRDKLIPYIQSLA